jgi:hypothetical protein
MERLTLPKSAIKSVAHLGQVSLEMFFRYPAVRAGYHCFGIGNQAVRPRQQLHGIFRIIENSPMMCDLQPFGSHLIASPPISSYLGDQCLAKIKIPAFEQGLFFPATAGATKTLRPTCRKQPVPTVTLGSRFLLKDQEIHVLVNRLV